MFNIKLIKYRIIFRTFQYMHLLKLLLIIQTKHYQPLKDTKVTKYLITVKKI